MTLPPEYNTPTMAEIYASQGYLDKAVQVYEHLLSRTPDREELRSALTRVQARLTMEGKEQAGLETLPQHSHEKADVSMLLEEWVRLLLQEKRLRELKKVENKMNLHE